MEKSLQAVTLAAAAFLSAGCLVQIDHVADPEPAFREARREALRLQGRPGPARELNALVYDGDEGKLVRVSLPMWLVRKIERHADKDWDDADDDQDAADRAKRILRRRVRLKEIERAGLGILVEVEEEDGERVLVWLR